MAGYKLEYLGTGKDPTIRVPTEIIETKLLSDTHHAYDCFVGQRFSNSLQAYLINYVISVSSMYHVAGERGR